MTPPTPTIDVERASKCQHTKITTFVFEDTGMPCGLWACASCRLKFEPRSLVLEEPEKVCDTEAKDCADEIRALAMGVR